MTDAALSAHARASRPFYGWGMLTAVAFAQMVSWGVLYYGFSVFLPPVRAEMGWSLPAMTGAFSVSLLISGVVGVFVGRWIDGHGPRALMTAGSAAATLLILAWAGVSNIVVFYLIWAGIGVVTAAVLYEPVFALVALWFVRYRSRALTLLTFIGGLASVVFVPLAAWLQRVIGWRAALVVLALVVAVVTIPVHLLVVRWKPQKMGLLPDGDTSPPTGGDLSPSVGGVSVSRSVAIRSASFRWLNVGFCLALFANLATTVLLIPYLTDRGFGSAFAASAAGLIGILSLPGRLVFTPLGGRLPRRYVTALIFILQTMGLVVLASVHTAAGVWVFVVLFGAGFGALTPARASIIMDLYGPAHYASIAGVASLIKAVAQGIAPLSAGLLYAAVGGYIPVFWTMAAISTLAIGAILLIGNDARTVTDIPPPGAETAATL